MSTYKEIGDSIIARTVRITDVMEDDWEEVEAKKWCEENEPRLIRENKEKIQEFINEFPEEFKKDARIQFINQQIEKLDTDIEDAITRAKTILTHSPEWVSDLFLEINEVEQKIKQIKRYRFQLDNLDSTTTSPDWVSESEIEQAKNTDIVQAGLVKGTKRYGKTLVLCPFHEDRKPSCVIYPSGKGFYCYSCNTGGDVIKFIMKTENLPFNKAVQLINK